MQTAGVEGNHRIETGLAYDAPDAMLGARRVIAVEANTEMADLAHEVIAANSLASSIVVLEGAVEARFKGGPGQGHVLLLAPPDSTLKEVASVVDEVSLGRAFMPGIFFGL